MLFHRCISFLILVIGSLALPAHAGSNPDQILLAATFNDRPLNAQIGTGGAAVGEPVSISTSLEAVVVPPGGFPSPHLRLRKPATGPAITARFELQDSAEITAGEVRIGFSVRIEQSGGSFQVRVREQATAAESFLDLRLAGGQITASSAGTASSQIGSYVAASTLAFELRFLLETGTHSILLNGVTLASNRPTGISSGRGVGAVLFGFDSQVSSVGRDWFLDDVYVYRPDRLFTAGFEAGVP
ncbi:MAG: hypothetical protein MUE46_06205 [Xanthomonadales bacterium]|jgi:hypothetical protein|nr:hypothetical protein [Xanthomonadales bacterium]